MSMLSYTPHRNICDADIRFAENYDEEASVAVIE